ncbi:hypothetical protein H7171_01280 [Candidatus Saccharibacteria bacterium]|nr:hypothetical protein [Candidatus Saccharibacteria bacterium]
MITNKQFKKQHSAEQGIILVAILGITIFLTVIILAIFSLANANLSRAKGRIGQLEAQYAAEAGADSAVATLNSGMSSYTGTTSEVVIQNIPSYRATFTVAVTPGRIITERILTATGLVYSPATATTAKYRQTIRVTTQQSSTSSASSIVSRNIFAISSGVKNVYAKDVFVNGFITMSKNTTNLVAENITVAGKNTSAGNCSIGGAGNLVKPSAFVTIGQTKTNVTTAYNNCITPPGNNSNNDFNVMANQGTIATVQSVYVPWAQFMDNTYQNSQSGCADWTGTGLTHNIPSSLGSKQTHYPDSSSTVSVSCGTNGDLSLGSGQYNITDNVHLRANLCVTSACSPTFFNPTNTIKYVFVEGDVNFASVQTMVGSGPIALIVYGTDPSSNTSICPYGGAAYLGNSGTTSAPALYILANNGVCLDKTKFSTSPAIGGVGGKNIYIATNPGSPFDLRIDPNFPVSQIPINLTWRAVYYQKL